MRRARELAAAPHRGCGAAKSTANRPVRLLEMGLSENRGTLFFKGILFY